MMKKRNIIFLLGIGLLFFSSCSHQLTPFTQQLVDQQQWKESDLKKIQFYVSEDIILQRRASKGYSKIEDGKIKLEKGEKLDQVLIRRGTPGVFLFSPKENRYAISFESNDPPKFLMFGPNPNYHNRYALLGKEWDRYSGVVTYDDKEYMADSDAALAYLLVDLRKAMKKEIKSREAGGRRIE